LGQLHLAALVGVERIAPAEAERINGRFSSGRGSRRRAHVLYLSSSVKPVPWTTSVSTGLPGEPPATSPQPRPSPYLPPLPCQARGFPRRCVFPVTTASLAQTRGHRHRVPVSSSLS